MSRIFISACTSRERGGSDHFTDRTKSAMQIIWLRDQIVAELRSRGSQVLATPDDYSPEASIQWINNHSRLGDVAIEILPNLSGTSIFYIANNSRRKQQAELIFLFLSRRIPQMVNRGCFPDTAATYGNLSFCRQVIIPSLLMEISFLNLPDERESIRNMALGLSDGLIGWSQEISGGGQANLLSPVSSLELRGAWGECPIIYPTIKIQINERNYDEQGLVINDNAYIPIDLADRFGVFLNNSPSVRLLQYQGLVYFKAIDLREHHISVNFDDLTGTLILRSNLKISRHEIELIMGYGKTSLANLTLFLQKNNEKALSNFPELPELYIEEAAIEGVNHDLAFAQMCLETDFLDFANEIKPSQNNFARLATIGGGATFATFTSSSLGVRAHIQHLKAYASREPLVKDVIDPRFDLVTRGVAPSLRQLSGRWSANLGYGDQIMAILRRLYESANLL